MMTVMGRVPWLTVDGNLVAGNDDFSHQGAPVRRFVGGSVARAGGEMRTVVHDDVFVVSVEFGQDSLFSMSVMRAVPLVVARAVVVPVVWHVCGF